VSRGLTLDTAPVAGHRDWRSFCGLATVSRLCERAPGRRWLRGCGVPPWPFLRAQGHARGVRVQRPPPGEPSGSLIRRRRPEAAPGGRHHAPVARQKQVVLTQTRDIPALRYLTCACWDRHVARVKSLGCQSRRYGRYCGSRVETLAGCFRSCDGPRWWASVDLSPRQRDSAPATVLGSLQRCVPLRDHRKCVGNVKIGERSTPAFPKVRYRLRGSRM
jgi:hypothetical protein